MAHQIKNDSRLQALVRLIRKSKRILLTTHMNPDGDAVGSLIALGLGLKQIKKKRFLYMRDSVPRIYQFLPSQKLIQNKLPEQNHDLTLLVDVGHSDRVSDEFKKFKGRGFVATIDHHSAGMSDADRQFCFPKSAATGELIYEILRLLRVKITKAIATNLYTAISTDTGSFKYSNTTAQTFQIAAKLVALGVNVWEVAENSYETLSAPRMELMRCALANMTLHENQRISWIVLRQADFIASKALPEDTEGLINIPRSIDTVEVAIFFKEQADGKIKVSFRSRVQVDVAKLALEWKGGGHARAAGCTIEGSMDEVVKQVVSRIERVL